MLFLPGNVSLHGRHFRLADGKSGVAVLPMEPAKARALGLDPFRRASFYFLHNFSQREGLRLGKEHMHVVTSSIDREARRMKVVGDAGEVCMELALDVRPYQIGPVFGRED